MDYLFASPTIKRPATIRVGKDQSSEDYNLTYRPYKRNFHIRDYSDSVIDIGYYDYDFSKIPTGKVVFERL
jgi:hypothetical protein